MIKSLMSEVICFGILAITSTDAYNNWSDRSSKSNLDGEMEPNLATGPKYIELQFFKL